MTRTSFVAKCIKQHGGLDLQVTGSPTSCVMKRAIQKTSNCGTGSPNTVVVHRPAWVGVGLFGTTAPLHFFLELNASVTFAAVTLALIGGAYIGFGALDGRTRVFWSELVVAILFGTAAVLGMLWHWLALPLGLALHAFWDLLHHKSNKIARIPGWYIPLCVVYDLLAASFLILLYGVWM